MLKGAPIQHDILAVLIDNGTESVVHESRLAIVRFFLNVTSISITRFFTQNNIINSLDIQNTILKGKSTLKSPYRTLPQNRFFLLFVWVNKVKNSVSTYL